MEIVLAKEKDCCAILDLQKLAYQQEAEIYHDFSIPPLTQTIEELQQEFSKLTILKCVVNHNITGSVRACTKDNTCFIGRLMVHPYFQNQSIGTNLMQKIETAFNHVERYELFTGEKSNKSLYLYHKLGYCRYKIETMNDNVNIIYLEKFNKP